jgi:hypothetical protein
LRDGPEVDSDLDSDDDDEDDRRGVKITTTPRLVATVKARIVSKRVSARRSPVKGVKSAGDDGKAAYSSKKENQALLAQLMKRYLSPLTTPLSSL